MCGSLKKHSLPFLCCWVAVQMISSEKNTGSHNSKKTNEEAYSAVMFAFTAYFEVGMTICKWHCQKERGSVNWQKATVSEFTLFCATKSVVKICGH